MEPMTLGSPNSPQASNSGFLPAFLMGDNTPATPRNTTLSPTKGRSLAFGHSPNSPKDLNRSLFSTTTTTSPSAGTTTSLFNVQSSNQNLNASVSGPPTQGLFDSLRSERSSIHAVSTPRADPIHSQRITSHHNDSPYPFAAMTSPRPVLPGPTHNFLPSSYNPASTSLHLNSSTNIKMSDFWVTVFGFPQSATPMILAHFSQCGTIVDKVFPLQNAGNWIHIKFTSRLECDKALNYNEKILNNCLMVGVTRCKDASILEREKDDVENSSFVGNISTIVNTSTNVTPRPMAIRPFANVAYKTAQSPIDVTPNPATPTRSSGIVDKAMDFFFGW